MELLSGVITSGAPNGGVPQNRSSAGGSLVAGKDVSLVWLGSKLGMEEITILMGQKFEVWLVLVLFLSVRAAVFNWVSKVIGELLWFCFTIRYDWFKKLAPPSQPTNRELVTRVFPRLALVTCILSSHWFILLFTSVGIGHCNCFGFGFYSTQLKTVLYNWKPLYYGAEICFSKYWFHFVFISQLVRKPWMLVSFLMAQEVCEDPTSKQLKNSSNRWYLTSLSPPKEHTLVLLHTVRIPLWNLTLPT